MILVDGVDRKTSSSLSHETNYSISSMHMQILTLKFHGIFTQKVKVV